MKHSGYNRLIIALILGAYLVTGALSPRTMLSQDLFSKLGQSLSAQAQRSIVLDERPYWTSHKHLISSEQSSGDHDLSIAEPWNGHISSDRLVEVPPQFFPIDSPVTSSASLRAPPTL